MYEIVPTINTDINDFFIEVLFLFYLFFSEILQLFHLHLFISPYLETGLFNLFVSYEKSLNFLGIFKFSVKEKLSSGKMLY